MKRPVKIKAAAVYASLLLIIAAAALFSAVHTCIGRASGVTAAVTDENASGEVMYRVTVENRNGLFLFYYKKPPDKIVIYTDKEAKEGDLVFALTTGNMTHSYPPVCKAELTLIF
ncbi:MAG: hypothetical protein IJT56_00270 [Clostridia bacterium]|nr:hypothetical protein [Clostridia bacterium]